MKMNPSKENLNGCSEQKKNEEEGISSILEEFATYICDKICPSNYMTMTQEEQEQCCAVCKLESYIDRIGQEYDEINTFSKTSAYQLMQKYKKYRALSGMRLQNTRRNDKCRLLQTWKRLL